MQQIASLRASFRDKPCRVEQDFLCHPPSHAMEATHPRRESLEPDPHLPSAEDAPPPMGPRPRIVAQHRSVEPKTAPLQEAMQARTVIIAIGHHYVSRRDDLPWTPCTNVTTISQRRPSMAFFFLRVGDSEEEYTWKVPRFQPRSLRAICCRGTRPPSALSPSTFRLLSSVTNS